MPIATVMTQHQGAELSFESRHVTAGARVAVTPAGLIAIGAMVSAILLGSAAIVRASVGGRDQDD